MGKSQPQSFASSESEFGTSALYARIFFYHEGTKDMEKTTFELSRCSDSVVIVLVVLFVSSWLPRFEEYIGHAQEEQPHADDGVDVEERQVHPAQVAGLDERMLIHQEQRDADEARQEHPTQIRGEPKPDEAGDRQE